MSTTASHIREGSASPPHAMLQVWAAVDRRLGVPLNATWAMTALAFIIGLPLLHSSETFFALASISSVGLNLSCRSPESLLASALTDAES